MGCMCCGLEDLIRHTVSVDMFLGGPWMYFPPFLPHLFRAEVGVVVKTVTTHKKCVLCAFMMHSRAARRPELQQVRRGMNRLENKVLTRWTHVGAFSLAHGDS